MQSLFVFFHVLILMVFFGVVVCAFVNAYKNHTADKNKLKKDKETNKRL